MKKLALLSAIAVYFGCMGLYGPLNNAFDSEGENYDTSPSSISFDGGGANIKAGSSIAYADYLLAIGVPEDRRGSDVTGSVWLYNRVGVNQWSFKEKIQPESLSDGDEFGKSVAISNGIVFIGSPGYSNDDGRIYQVAVPDDGSKSVGKTAFTPPYSGGRLGETMVSNGTFVVTSAPFSDSGRIIAFSATDPDNRVVQTYDSGSLRNGSLLAVHENRLLVGGTNNDKVYYFQVAGIGTSAIDLLLVASHVTLAGESPSAIALGERHYVVGFQDYFSEQGRVLFRYIDGDFGVLASNIPSANAEGYGFLGSAITLVNDTAYVGSKGGNGGIGIVTEFTNIVTNHVDEDFNHWPVSDQLNPLDIKGNFGETLFYRDNLLFVGSPNNGAGGRVDIFLR